MTLPETVGTILRGTEQRLEQQGIVSSRAEAETLLTQLLGKTRAELLLDFTLTISEVQKERLEAWLGRRFAGEPLQYIVGSTGFHHLELEVGPGVLVPRPETEVLVEAVLRQLSAEKHNTPWVLDLGTGSGNIALALALAMPGLRVLGVDRSPPALEIARRNLHRSGFTDRVQFVEGDLYDAPGCEPRSFDYIVSNPPYIASSEIAALPREVRNFEPRAALDGGADGLGVIRAILEKAPQYLKAGGWLFLELGAGQSETIASWFSASRGWEPAEFQDDLCGIPRVAKVRLAAKEAR